MGTRLASGSTAAEDGEACLRARRRFSARGKSATTKKDDNYPSEDLWHNRPNLPLNRSTRTPVNSGGRSGTDVRVVVDKSHARARYTAATILANCGLPDARGLPVRRHARQVRCGGRRRGGHEELQFHGACRRKKRGECSGAA